MPKFEIRFSALIPSGAFYDDEDIRALLIIRRHAVQILNTSLDIM